MPEYFNISINIYRIYHKVACQWRNKNQKWRLVTKYFGSKQVIIVQTKNNLLARNVSEFFMKTCIINHFCRKKKHFLLGIGTNWKCFRGGLSPSSPNSVLKIKLVFYYLPASPRLQLIESSNSWQRPRSSSFCFRPNSILLKPWYIPLVINFLRCVQGSRGKEFVGEKINPGPEFEPALIIRQPIKQRIIK